MVGPIPSKSKKDTPTRCILLGTEPMMADYSHTPASETELQTKHKEYLVKIQSNRIEMTRHHS